MKLPIVILLALHLASPAAFAAGNSQKREERNIAKVLTQLTIAWRAGDREAWADAFAEDAYFTVWFELKGKGKEQLAWDHQLIFDAFYADTAFDIDVRQIRFVRPDVAVVELTGFVARPNANMPAAPDAVPKVVFERVGTEWKVTAFQNTPFVVNEYRAYGELRRFQRVSAENYQKH
jgi:uncharacterized protein (TIGR02246 family)